MFCFVFVSAEACRLNIPYKNQAVIYLLHRSCVTIITLESVPSSDAWLCRKRCMKWTKSFLIFILHNKPEIWGEVKHVFKLNHTIMTKKECRGIHPYPDTYNAMTRYYFSYQMDLYKLGILYVTDIQQSDEQSSFFSWTSTHQGGEYIDLHFAGTKTSAKVEMVDPHMG